MKVYISRMDNNLCDISTPGEPALIPTLVNVELEAVMPYGPRPPDIFTRGKPPYFRRLEATPQLGKMTADATLPLTDLPCAIQEHWFKFQAETIAWVENQINRKEGNDA